MKNLKRLSLFLVLLLAAGLAVGCGGTAEEEGTPEGGEPQEAYINHSIGDEPPDLASVTTTDTYSLMITSEFQEGLVRQQPDGSFPQGSGLAESWTVSEDGTVYTFKLKPGLKWSTGNPLTSADFANAWKFAIDPRNAAQYAYQLYHIKGAEAVNTISLPDPAEDGQEAYDQAVAQIEDGLANVGIETPDELTLQVTLERPTPFWVSLTSFPTYFPVDWKFFEELGGPAKLGGEYAAEADKLSAIGPFKMSKWVHDSEIELVKNPDYWDAETVKLDRIHYDIITDNSTAINMYEAGDLDRVGIGEKFLEQYKDDPTLTIDPDGSVWYITLNMIQPEKPDHEKLFKNAKFRQALSYAIDRETLATQVQKTHVPAKIYTSTVISDLEGNNFYETWIKEPLWPTKADPAKAKQLLAEALEEVGLDQAPADIVVMTDESDTARTRDEAIQEMWRQNLGLEVKLEPVDFKTRLERSRNHQYDIVFSGWGPDYNDPMTFLDMWVTGGPYNDGGYSNPAYDDLVAQAREEFDNSKRMGLFKQMEEMIAEEIPVIVLDERMRYNVTRPWVKGLLHRAIGAEYEYKWVTIEGRE